MRRKYPVYNYPTDDDGWILIEDGLPEEEDSVIFYSGIPYYEGTLGTYDTSDENRSPWKNEEGGGVKGVTHWKPFRPPGA